MSVNEIKNIYSSVSEEYQALKHGTGIYLSPDSKIVKLVGKDALDFLHRVSSNSVKELQSFEKKHTLFLNEKGRFIDRTILLNFESYYLLIGNPDKDGKLFNWINKYIIMEDIQTNDVSNDYLLIELIGPQSESYLTLLIGDEIKKLTDVNIIDTHADGFNFHLFSCNECERKSYRILINRNQADEFVEYMLQNKSVFDVALTGTEAYKIYQVENGIPSAPNEINDNNNPHETNLIGDVNFNKGCYIGQEVIARLDTYDQVRKKLMGIIPEENLIPNGTFKLLDAENNEAGEITSLVESELLKRQIGLGIVRGKNLNDDNKLYVKSGGKKYSVSVCELPFKK